MLLNRCVKRIGHILGSSQQQAWCQNLQRRFISTHWVVPYPTPGTFVSKIASGRIAQGKYRWWTSRHPAVTHAFPCTDAIPPPLVTAEMAPELPVDEWAVSTTLMNIRIQLPSTPSDLSAFLHRLPMCATPLPPLVDDEIIFPVDIIRPHFRPLSRKIHDSQPRQLRKRAPRPPKCWAWSSVTPSQPLNPPANQLTRFEQWLSEFRPAFQAEQAKLSQCSGPGLAVVKLSPMPRIPRRPLPAAHDHHPTFPSSPCFHPVPFDPHYGSGARDRLLVPVVGPWVPLPRNRFTSSDMSLPPTGRHERGFMSPSTANLPQPAILTEPLENSMSLLRSHAPSLNYASVSVTSHQANKHTMEKSAGPISLVSSNTASSDTTEIATANTSPESGGATNSSVLYTSARSSPPRGSNLPPSQVFQVMQARPQLRSNVPQLAHSAINDSRHWPSPSALSQTTGSQRQVSRVTSPSQAVRQTPRVPITLYTWTIKEQENEDFPATQQAKKRGGRRAKYRTGEERRAAGRLRTRKYREKLAALKKMLRNSSKDSSLESRFVIDPLALLLGRARMSRYYY